MKSIRAKISDKGLKKVAFFFNHSPQTLLAEILQNSRRAKATMVEITAVTAGKNTRVVVTDNGTGIEDAENLLHLWESGWEEEIQTLENPAGFGFFSLSHLPLGVTVRSQNWETHIGQHIFEGNGEAEVQENHPHLTGTRITFHLPQPLHEVVRCVQAAAFHFPIPVKLNRKPVEQEDFLKDAKHVFQYEGGRIGIYEHEFNCNQEQLNFHGITLRTPIPCPHKNWGIRVDIHSNKLVDLVLPARNAVAENQKWEDLKAMCRRATYEYAGKRDEHSLSYRDWLEAKSMGIELPEAANNLQVCLPRNIQNWTSGWDDNVAPGYPRADRVTIQAVTKDSIISNLNEAEVGALHMTGLPIPMLYNGAPEMDGYSWYPENHADEVSQHVTFGEETLVCQPDGTDWDKVWAKSQNGKKRPGKITLELRIVGLQQKKKVETYATHIAFTSEECGDDAIQTGWLGVAGKNAEKIDSNTLSALFFSPSDDYESDSYESQHEYFDEEAKSELIRRHSGAKQEARHRIHRTVDVCDVRCAMRDLKITKFEVIMGKNGQITIHVPKTPAPKTK